MNKVNRNEVARQFIIEQLDRAETKSESDFEKLSEYEYLSQILVDLIEVRSMGFRGVVATALTGLHLDPDFDPLKNFYACHPRSIFENGIFYAYQGRIPCGKSDPLNVAKNQNELDYKWAKGKRPQESAEAVVNFLSLFMSAKDSEKELIRDFYFYRLLKYSKKVTEIRITTPNDNELSSQELAHRLVEFVYKYPESGTIPQYITSLLLKYIYSSTEIEVKGGDESVFGTNTTSKKPADIWLEKSGNVINLYEITVKKVDFKRLDDSLQSLQSLNMENENIYFICRIPEDIITLSNVNDNTIYYKGKKFNFLDLKGFILSLITLLSKEQLKMVIDNAIIFINKIDRPISTKDGWNSIFK